jgi:glutamate/tyrosine decarboxylase-like PLP-dependent enzyme
MHYSFDKGMDLLGLGARSVWRLETDEQNRLSLAALERALLQCKEQKLKVLDWELNTSTISLILSVLNLHSIIFLRMTM